MSSEKSTSAVISELLEAEKEASSILDKAKKEVEKIEEKLRRDIEKEEDSFKRILIEKKEKMIAEYEDRISKERAKIIKEAEKEASSLSYGKEVVDKLVEVLSSNVE